MLPATGAHADERLFREGEIACASGGGRNRLAIGDFATGSADRFGIHPVVWRGRQPEHPQAGGETLGLLDGHYLPLIGIFELVRVEKRLLSGLPWTSSGPGRPALCGHADMRASRHAGMRRGTPCVQMDGWTVELGPGRTTGAPGSGRRRSPGNRVRRQVPGAVRAEATVERSACWRWPPGRTQKRHSVSVRPVAPNSLLEKPQEPVRLRDAERHVNDGVGAVDPVIAVQDADVAKTGKSAPVGIQLGRRPFCSACQSR